MTITTADFIGNSLEFPFGAPTVDKSVTALRKLADAVESGRIQPLFVGVASATREGEYLLTELTFRYVERGENKEGGLS